MCCIWHRDTHRGHAMFAISKLMSSKSEPFCCWIFFLQWKRLPWRRPWQVALVQVQRRKQDCRAWSMNSFTWLIWTTTEPFSPLASTYCETMPPMEVLEMCQVRWLFVQSSFFRKRSKDQQPVKPIINTSFISSHTTTCLLLSFIAHYLHIYVLLSQNPESFRFKEFIDHHNRVLEMCSDSLGRAEVLTGARFWNSMKPRLNVKTEHPLEK